MLKIVLALYGREFEYDIYTLVKAFYPAAKITVFEGAAPENDGADMSMELYIREERADFTITEKGAIGAGFEGAYDASAERPARKSVLKRLVYRGLSEYTGKELPWGDLTGIRPVRIAMRLLEEGADVPEAGARMRSEYFTTAQKASLAAEIAARELEILKGIDTEKGYSLYVGIPFCPSICLYCSFGSHPLDRFSDRVGGYFEALEKELLFIAKECAGRELTSVYIGGGTPTSVDADTLAGLLEFIGENFPLENVREFTLEAGRPDTITAEKLKRAKSASVTRLSVNPQTMNDRTLRIIGREHTSADIVKAFYLARESGFDDINMDIIAGLPGEGKEQVAHTLAEIEKLSPESLTVHSLALKRSTRLNLRIEEYAPFSFDNSVEVMDMAAESAARMGMVPYYLYRQKNMAGNLENVGYAKEGSFGIYNVITMEEKQTVMAAGSGAMTKFVLPGGRIERVPDVKDVDSYIARIDEMISRKKEAMEKHLPPL